MDFSDQDKMWMQRALQLAQNAADHNEVPIGAVLVANDVVIAEGMNSPITSCDPTAHAEINALRAAGQAIQNYRLVNTTLYVTLEPCIMCIGAIIHARIERVVFGAYDARVGSLQQVFTLFDLQKLNHKVNCEGGLLEEDCAKVLKHFFKTRR